MKCVGKVQTHTHSETVREMGETVRKSGRLSEKWGRLSESGIDCQKVGETVRKLGRLSESRQHCQSKFVTMAEPMHQVQTE